MWEQVAGRGQTGGMALGGDIKRPRGGYCCCGCCGGKAGPGSCERIAARLVDKNCVPALGHKIELLLDLGGIASPWMHGVRCLSNAAITPTTDDLSLISSRQNAIATCLYVRMVSPTDILDIVAAKLRRIASADILFPARQNTNWSYDRAASSPCS